MKKIIPYAGTLLVFGIAYFIYYSIVRHNITTDVQSHAYAAIDIMAGKIDMPPNFLYFSTVYFLSGCSNDYYFVIKAAILIMALSVTLKYFVTYKIVKESILLNQPGFTFSINKLAIILLISIAMIFLFAIPYGLPLDKMYLYYRGKIPPNTWHNSTSVFLIPFSLMLFWNSYITLAQKDSNNLISTIVLVILNLAIKPSFFFVYLSVFPLFLLYEYKFSKRFFTYLIPGCVGMLYLVIQFYVIFVLDSHYGQDSAEKARVAIAPFYKWTRLIQPRLIPVALVSSLLLPFTYFAIYTKEIKEKLNLYAISLFVVGLMVYILFMETGPRENHGNFVWQTFICSYIMFLVVVLNIIKKYINKEFESAKGKKIFYVLTFLFSLHFISGLVYLYRIFHFKTFY